MSRRATPYLAVDEARLDRNIARMAELARGRGVSLRPHAKTHKSPEVARRQLAAGAVGLTVATVAEAEAFTRSLAPQPLDLFIAYPLWVDEDKGRRLRALAACGTELSVGIDSEEAATALAAHGVPAAVLVEVDSGQHRSGVHPAEAGRVAAAAGADGLHVAGVFTFPGHSYLPGAAAATAAEESAALTAAVHSLAAVGLDAAVVSGGSTPSAEHADGTVLTELRPGNYVFADAQQWELGTADPDSIALTCVGTVVSHGSQPSTVVLDCGSKVLGADRAPWSSGFGRVADHPAVRVTALSEHHAVLAWDGSPRPSLGSRVPVVPNHACSAVNLVDELVLDGDRSWPVTARGANT